MRVTCRGIDFIPPSEPDKAPSGDVFQVVKVGREEEHGEDEYEDTEDVSWVSPEASQKAGAY